MYLPTFSYSSSPFHLLLLHIIISLLYFSFDISCWPLPILLTHKRTFSCLITDLSFLFVYSLIIWLATILIISFSMRRVLAYTDWIFDNPKEPTLKTNLWRIFLKLFFRSSKKRKLYENQKYLPKLPLPELESTISKYLHTIKPIFSEEFVSKHTVLSRDFLHGEGVELQTALEKRHSTTENYVSEYWEDYGYLRGGRRSKHPTEDTSPNPGIMINTSVALYAPIGTRHDFRHASRAASISHLLMHYKALIDSEKFPPYYLPGTNVPFCSEQYRRQISSYRVPCKGKDRLVYYPGIQYGHTVVIHKGRFFKVDYYENGKLVSPKQLEKTFTSILNDDSPSTEIDTLLPSYTGADRDDWAEFRERFLSTGQNRENMRYLDTAAFVVILDEEVRYLGKLPKEGLDPIHNIYPKNTDIDHMSHYAGSVLHGNGHNRWFDKGINLVVFKTGLYGYSIEHTSSDAPALVQVIECVNEIEMDYFFANGSKHPVPVWVDNNLVQHTKTRYNVDGFINDDSDPKQAVCTRLEWDFKAEAHEKIKHQAVLTAEYANSIKLKMCIFDRFGKNRMKQIKMSPDAFVQMAIQLAYYKDQKEFALTYESGLTRMFKWGRTETIRSVTEDSCRFVLAMLEEEIDAYKALKLLQTAGKSHNATVKQAMVGQGVDRHLFALYITSQLQGINSPFLNEVISIPFKLSTSQVTGHQINEDYKARPDLMILGGGFGPVTKHGYGVGYFFNFEKLLTFHITSFNASPHTNAIRFYNLLEESLVQMEKVSTLAMQIPDALKDESKMRFISYKDSISFD